MSPPISMGVLRHRNRHPIYLRRHHHRLSTLTAFSLLLFTITIGYGETVEKDTELLCRILSQRQQERVIGPGSSPPTCISKCENCYPCKPARVPVQPGFSTPLEYYPEAWRCKCGNKLFMP